MSDTGYATRYVFDGGGLVVTRERAAGFNDRARWHFHTTDDHALDRRQIRNLILVLIRDAWRPTRADALEDDDA